MRNATIQPRRSTNTAARVTTNVCVVDARSGDYQAWRERVGAGAHVEFVGTAAEALRIARSQPIDLWVVNAQLAGISGHELCAMLKARSTSAAVCLVADEYSPNAERNAWAARASMFCCQPAHFACIDQWLDQHAARLPARPTNCTANFV